MTASGHTARTVCVVVVMLVASVAHAAPAAAVASPPDEDQTTVLDSADLTELSSTAVDLTELFSTAGDEPEQRSGATSATSARTGTARARTVVEDTAADRASSHVVGNEMDRLAVASGETSRLTVDSRPGDNYTVTDDFDDQSGPWTYVGSAEYTEDGEHVILTRPIEGGQAGILWLDRKLNPPFTAEFEFKAGGGSGADGVVFMFNKKRQYDPNGGGSLAFLDEENDPVPGYGVEFDNWYNRNFDDPSDRHIAIIEDSVGNHLASTSDSRVEDNEWHDARVVATRQSVTVFVDGQQVLQESVDVNTTYSSVGFAGSTGGSNNFHRIDDVRIVGRVAASGNLPPQPALTVSPRTPTAEEPTTLSANGSRDPNGDTLQYEWDLDGDGEVEATGETVDRTFPAGDRTVTLTVSDGVVNRTVTRTITVREGDTVPTARVRVDETTTEPVTVEAGTTLQFDARNSTVADGRSVVSYEWSFGDGDTASGTTDSPAAVVTHAYRSPGTYEVTLTVTDSAGLTDTVTRRVEVTAPETPVVTELSQPAGGRVPLPASGESDVLPNTWRVDVSSADPISFVRFRFPNNQTVTDRDGSDGWTASIPLDQLESGTVVVTVRDEDGDTTRESASVETLALPGWASDLALDEGRVVLETGYQFPEFQKDLGVAEFNVSFSVRQRLQYDVTDGTVVVGGGGGGAARAIPPSGVGVEIRGSVDIEGQGTVTDRRIVVRRVVVSGEIAGGPVFQREVGLSNAIAVEVTSKVLVGGEVSTTLDVTENVSIDRGTLSPEVIVVPASVSTGTSVGGVTLAEVGVTGEVRLGGEIVYNDTTSVGGTVSGQVEAYAILVGQKYTTRLGAGVSTGSTALAGPASTGATGGATTGASDRLTAGASGAVTEEVSGPAREWQLVQRETVSPATYWERVRNGTASVATLGDATPSSETVTPSSATVTPSSVTETPSSVTATPASSEALTTTQLTDNGVSDRAPALTSTGGTVTAVSVAQDPEKTVLNGTEIVTQTRTDGTWQRGPAVTSDSRYDAFPAVAGADGDRLVAWSRANSSLTPAETTSPFDTFRHLDVAVVPSARGGWGAITRLTDNSLPEFDTTVAGTGDAWLVAWVTDTDRSLSTTADRRVDYAVLGADGATVLERGSVDSARAVDVAVTDDGRFRLVALQQPNGTSSTRIVDLAVASSGSVEERTVVSAPNASAVTTSGSRLAWVDESTTPARIAVQNASGERETLTPGRAGLEHPTLLSTDERDVLAYEAVPTRGRGPSTLYVQIAGSEASGWTAPTRLQTDNRSVQRAAFLARGEQVVGVFAATPNPNVRPDLYATERRLGRADLAVNVSRLPGTGADTTASDGSSTLSDSGSTTLADGGSGTTSVTVTNDGGARSGETTVLVATPSGETVTRTVEPLSPGESTVVGFDFGPLETGRLTARVDPNATVAEANERNNRDTRRLQTDLAVVGVTDRLSRNRSGLAVTVTVANRGPFLARNVTYEVQVGEQTYTREIPGVGVGRNWSTTVQLPASAVSTGQSAVVTVAPSQRGTAGIAFGDNRRRVTLRQPDLAAPRTPTLAGTNDTRLRGSLRNSDTGPTTAATTVTVGDDTVTYRVPLPASRGPSDSVERTVSLELPSRGAATVSVTPTTGTDADLSDNVVQTPAPENATDAAASGSAETGAESVRSLAVDAVTGGAGTASVTVRNPHDIVVGQVVTVRRGGDVIERRGVAVLPEESETVTVTVPDSGQYTVTVGETERSVGVTEPCVASAVAGDDGAISLRELQRLVDAWADGERIGGQSVDLRQLQQLVNAWAEGDTVDCDG